MVAITRFHQMTETRSLPVGVFEDDALLLGLGARSQLTESGRRSTLVLINSDDLAIEAARLADVVTWDM